MVIDIEQTLKLRKFNGKYVLLIVSFYIVTLMAITSAGLNKTQSKKKGEIFKSLTDLVLSNGSNAAAPFHVLNSSCTSHIPITRDKKKKYSSTFQMSCKMLPGPNVVASQCPNHHQVEQFINGFAQEQNNVQRYVMFLAGAHSGSSLVGSLLDAHPMMLVANEADIFTRWLGGGDYEYGESLPTRDEIFAEILSNSLKCALYTRWQHGYNYTVPGGWGGQWVPEKLAVIGDKKGHKTVLRLDELREKSETLMLESFRDFQRTIGLPIRIIHVYWKKNAKTKNAERIINLLQSEPTNVSVFEWDSTLYACGGKADRLALLSNVCKFLGVPCDSAILDIWNSMAKCKSASKHISSGKNKNKKIGA